MLENSNAVTHDLGINNFPNQIDGDSDKIEDLLFRFPQSEVEGALGNILGKNVGEYIKDLISESGLPQFAKDLANEAIDSAVAEESTPEAEAAEQETSEVFEEMVAKMMEDLNKELNEELEEADPASEGGSGGGKGEGAKGGANGNWLAVLAKTMGDVAGKHLGNSVRLSEEISAITGGGGSPDEQAEAMVGLQSQMQAETQMFKLSQEALTTIIKSVGEALSSTARKQ